MLDNSMSLADFETPLSHTTVTGPVDSILASAKSQVWQDTVRGVEHHEDTQQRYFHASQPKVTKKQHRYPTRSKSTRNANTVQPADNGGPTRFVYLRHKGEPTIPV